MFSISDLYNRPSSWARPKQCQLRKLIEFINQTFLGPKAWKYQIPDPYAKIIKLVPFKKENKLLRLCDIFFVQTWYYRDLWESRTFSDFLLNRNLNCRSTLKGSICFEVIGLAELVACIVRCKTYQVVCGNLL